MVLSKEALIVLAVTTFIIISTILSSFSPSKSITGLITGDETSITENITTNVTPNITISNGTEEAMNGSINDTSITESPLPKPEASIKVLRSQYYAGENIFFEVISGDKNVSVLVLDPVGNNHTCSKVESIDSIELCTLEIKTAIVLGYYTAFLLEDQNILDEEGFEIIPLPEFEINVVTDKSIYAQGEVIHIFIETNREAIISTKIIDPLGREEILETLRINSTHYIADFVDTSNIILGNYIVMVSTTEANASTIFEIRYMLPITSGNIVRNALGESLEGEIIFKQAGIEMYKTGLREVLQLPKGVYDIEIRLANQPVKSIILRDVSIQENITEIISFDDTPEISDFLEVFAINPVIDFSKAEILRHSRGNILYKCRDWDFSNRLCLGEWEKFMDIKEDEDYLFTFYPSDPGFGEKKEEKKPVVSFDRDLDCHKCGKHKAPPLTEVNMTITATVSEPVYDATFSDIYNKEWIVTNPKGGSIVEYNSTYNRIYWYVGDVTDFVTKDYIIKSPERSLPPTNYYFISKLNEHASNPWRVTVADPTYYAVFRPADEDGHENDWTPLGGGDHYVEVDEVTPDDAITEIHVTSGNQEDYWNLTDHTTETGVISNVRLVLRIRHSDGDNEEFAFALADVNDAEWISADVTDDNIWTTYTYDHAQSPFTSLDWTWDEIDEIELGIKSRAIGGFGGTEYCTQGFINVTYSPPLPGSLNITLMLPTSSPINVIQNKTFNVSANISCGGGACTGVNGTIFYNLTSNVYPDMELNGTVGEKPFYNFTNPVNISCGDMSDGDTCYVTWFVNVTGYIGSTWYLNVTTKSSDPTIVQNSTIPNFQVNIVAPPKGSLNVTLMNATYESSVNITQDTTFNVSANISCGGTGGAWCGAINGTIFYNLTSNAYPDMELNGTSTDKPFNNFTNIINISCGGMFSGETCYVSWLVNATGYLWSSWYLNVTAKSDDPSVTQNSTIPNFQINISVPLVPSLNTWDQEDDDEDKPPPPSGISEDPKVVVNESTSFWADYTDSNNNPIEPYWIGNLVENGSTIEDTAVQERPEALAAADIDGDNVSEIVVNFGRAGTVPILRIYNYTDADNFTLEASTTYGATWTDGRAMKLVDVDEDGTLEIIWTAISNPTTNLAYLYIYNYTTHGGAIQLEDSVSWDFGGVPAGVDGLDIVDVDGDGVLEIIVGGESGNGYSPRRPFIRIYNYTDGNLQLEAKYNRTTPAAGAEGIRYLEVQDIDKDGVQEIVTVGLVEDNGFYTCFDIYNYTGGSILNETPTVYLDNLGYDQYLYWGEVEDLDNDGYYEIIATARNQSDTVAYPGMIFIYNYTTHGGAIQSETEPYLSPDFTGFTRVRAVDVDFDGYKELVVGVGAYPLGCNPNCDVAVGVLNYTTSGGAILEEDNITYDGGSPNARLESLYVADITNDGSLEIITGVRNYSATVGLNDAVLVALTYTSPVCKIRFNDTITTIWRGMVYNSSNLFYEYNRLFSEVGFYLWNVTCSKPGYLSLSGNAKNITIQEVVVGNLNITLWNPENASMNVTQNYTFVVNASVVCLGDVCSNVNATVWYNLTNNALPNTILNSTVGDKPFYNFSGGNVTKFCGTLSINEQCNVSWVVNATGYLWSSWYLNVTFNSSDSTQNSSDNFQINITGPPPSSLNTWDQEDDDEDKPPPPSGISEDPKVVVNESTLFWANYTYDSNPIPSDSTGTLYENGTTEISAGGVFYAPTGLAIGDAYHDLDSDGIPEIVSVWYKAAGNPEVVVYNYTESDIFTAESSTSFDSTYASFYGYVKIADVDADGTLEIIFAIGTDNLDLGYVYIYNYTTNGGSLLQEAVSAGFPPYGCTDSSMDYPILRGIDVADIDQDGTLEIIIVGDAGAACDPRIPFMRIYNYTGGSINLEDEYNRTPADTGYELFQFVKAKDLDNDGVIELSVIGLKRNTTNGNDYYGMIDIFNHSGSLITNETPTTIFKDPGYVNCSFQSGEVEDIDKDGYHELIVVGYNMSTDPDQGMIFIYNYTTHGGSIQEEAHNSTPYFPMYLRVLAVDVDFDGYKELVIGSRNGTVPLDIVIVVSNYTTSGGAILEEDNITFAAGPTDIDARLGGFGVGDIDNDGKIEIVTTYQDAASGNDRVSYITALEYASPVCKIQFNDTITTIWRGMVYNSSNLFYEYNRLFSEVGFYLWNVTCSKPGYLSLSGNAKNITIQLAGAGILNITLWNPGETSTNITQNYTFIVNASVVCLGGTCSDINATVWYNLTNNALPDTILNSSVGDKPFYNFSGGNVTKLCGTLSQDEQCNVSWVVNATGYLWSSWYLNVTFNSSDSTQNSSDNFQINISLAVAKPSDTSLEKSLINTSVVNKFLITLNVTNKGNDNGIIITAFDFMPAAFTGSDFKPASTGTDSYQGGTIYYWDVTLDSGESTLIYYNITGSSDYIVMDSYLIGIDPKFFMAKKN